MYYNLHMLLIDYKNRNASKRQSFRAEQIFTIPLLINTSGVNQKIPCTFSPNINFLCIVSPKHRGGISTPFHYFFRFVSIGNIRSTNLI